MKKLYCIIAATMFVLLLGACGSDASKANEGDKTPSPATTQVTTTSLPQKPDRVVIPSILEAPLALQKVSADGAIPNPPDNDTVEVVDFSESLQGYGGEPGQGNTIMVGNFDSGTRACDGGKTPPPCSAVMKNLEKTKVGMHVQVTWQGKDHGYEVVSVCHVPADKLPSEIYLSTPQDQLTLFTFGGVFNTTTFRYSDWVIVIAQKIGTGAVKCPEGTSDGPPAVVTPVTNGPATAQAK